MRPTVPELRLRASNLVVLFGLSIVLVTVATPAGATPPPAPVPISPNGPTTNPDPIFTWNASSGATQYLVQVGDGTSIKQGLYTSAQVCSTTPCAVDMSRNLSAGVNYWWGVQAKNSSGGTWSASLNFTVQAPPAPVLISPNGPTTSVDPIFTWNASSGATQYFVQVGDGTSITEQGLYTSAQVCSTTPCAADIGKTLSAGVNYWWGVQAQNAAGSTWGVAGLNFTVQAPPPPNPVSPNGATGNPNPTYTWQPSSGATGYYLQVGDFSVITFSRQYDASACSGSTCVSSSQATPVLPIKSYWWTVTPQNAAGSGTASGFNFQVQAPPAPALSAPNGAVASSTPTFTWSASTGATAATSYRLQVMSGATQYYQVDYTPSLLGCTSTCSVTPSTALTAGSYSWSVRATNAAGSTWSSSLNFSYGSAPAPPTIISPNGPMTSVTPTLIWSVSPGATSYYIKVVDANNTSKFQGTFSASSYCSGTQCSLNPFLTLAVGDYSWTVTAQNTAGSAGSLSAPFTIGGCAGDVKTGDFNGDGRTDRLCVTPTSVVVSLGTPTGFATGTVWLSLTIGNILIGDFNGDGFTDIAKYDSTTAVYSVALSNGATGFGPLTTWGTANTPQIPQACAGTSAKADVGDFNGDGYMDVSCKLSGSPSVFIGLSNVGTGSNTFTFSNWGNAVCEAGERTGTIDVNGDGKSDWYCIGPTDDFTLAFLSTGTSFSSASISVTDATFCDDLDIFFGDFNGDGKTDVACKGNGKVRISTGTSFLDVGGMGGTWCNGSYQTSWPFAFAADVDGDGIPEMVCNGAGGGPQGEGEGLKVRKWLGTSLGPATVWATGFCGADITVGDFNGDGKVDILCNKNGTWASAGTVGTKADLVSQATNALGGAISVSYLPATSFTNGPGTGSRPLATQVVTSDGRNNSSSTTYTYGGGKMDFQQRQFLGFLTSRVDLPCLPESGCTSVTTTSSQTLPSAGKPTDVRQVDSDGFILSDQTYSYTESQGSTLPRTSLLSRTDSFLSARDGSSLHTYTTYPGYDAYGNLTQTVAYNDINNANDDVETDTDYFPKVSSYIVGLPARVQRKVPGQAATLVGEYEYDGTGTYTTEAVWNVPPSKGDLTAVSRYLNSPGRMVNRRMTYNTSIGLMLTTTDETNRPMTTTYETGTGFSLFPVTVTNPAGETTTLGWNTSCAALTTSTDPNNLTTSQTYDVLCRESRTTPPVTGAYLQKYYLNLGDPNQQKTRIETNAAFGVSGADWSEAYFDGVGRNYKTSERGPATGQDIVTEQAFNSRGGVASSTEAYYLTDGPQRVTNFQYDTQDRPTSTVLPDQNTINTAYGVLTTTVTDPNGKATTTRFDALGRVVAIERTFNSSPANIAIAYDTPFGLQKTVQDPAPATASWIWHYDTLGRSIDEVNPDSGHWQYAYDDAGRPTQQTDMKGQITTMTYDTGGRLHTKVSPVGTVTLSYGDPQTGCSNIGRLTKVTSPIDTLQGCYDALGRSIWQNRTVPALGTNYVVQRSFDTGGYLQTTTYPDLDGIGPVTYDEAGRVKSIPGVLTSVTYDAAGRPSQQTNANNTTTTWTYSPNRGFLTQVQTLLGATPIQTRNYGYDAAGFVTNTTGTEAWTYLYDDFYHLKSAQSGTNSADSQTFIFDADDRMTYNSRVGTYGYPGPGQANPHGPNNVNGVNYTYDLNGNLTSGNGRTPIWDGENRIAQIGSVQFGYDAFGERIAKMSSSATSIYPFGDDYEVTNGVVTKYISVEGLGVVAKKTAGNTYWMNTDRLGSVQTDTDLNGAVQHSQSYRPFGETLSSSGSLVESRGWIDQRNDGETGLTYLHARYFDPKLGLFLSPDPIGVAGGLNQYAYAAGNPIGGIDRSGLQTIVINICDPRNQRDGEAPLVCKPPDADEPPPPGSVDPPPPTGFRLPPFVLPGVGGGLLGGGAWLIGVIHPGGPNTGGPGTNPGFTTPPTENPFTPPTQPPIHVPIPTALPKGPSNPFISAGCRFVLSLDNSNMTPVPFTNDAGDVLRTKNEGAPIMRPAGWDPHYFTGVGKLMGLGTYMGAPPLGALANFAHGGIWDAQRVGVINGVNQDFVQSANIYIGLFGSAAHIPLGVTLSITNQYARWRSKFDFKIEPRDPDYYFIPARLRGNIETGYGAQTSGEVCTP